LEAEAGEEEVEDVAMAALPGRARELLHP
jgi:hypothetical protein